MSAITDIKDRYKMPPPIYVTSYSRYKIGPITDIKDRYKIPITDIKDRYEMAAHYRYRMVIY